MNVSYRAVLWNRQKKIYDITFAACIAAYLSLFLTVGGIVHPNATAETLLIRAFGTLAFLMLHVILCIGPLCRIDKRFLPLLYNRRHLGVGMFAVALVHGVFSVVQFHAFGDTHPLVSVLTANVRYGSIAGFPFHVLGFAALLVLMLMAATSHDFWLHNLSPGLWKRLHMGVYLAYALLVAHVALGAAQSAESLWVLGALFAGAIVVGSLHLMAARRESEADAAAPRQIEGGYVEVCPVDAIPEKRAKIVTIAGERVAVFRYDGKVSALSNVCRHQSGPLGEGKIVNGCVTCPWHGYQYAPDSGCSPPPFSDKVATFQTRVENGIVFVHTQPLPPGTLVSPALIDSEPEVAGRG